MRHDQDDARWMGRAVGLAARSPRSATAFAVGALIVDTRGREVAAGWSRDTDPLVHAEESALLKAVGDERLDTATLYSTLEPCSKRANRPDATCTSLILAARIPRVVIAWREPDIFVTCEGVALLIAAGVEVLELPQFAAQARAVNAHLPGMERNGCGRLAAVGDDEGGLNARDLVPAAGGEWHGLLFDNQAVGLDPALTWTFRVPFEPVGGAPAALEVDWLPIPAPGWRAMAGLSAASDSFAEPAEASVQHQHGHYRYDRVGLSVAEQDGPRIRAVLTVAGDLDALGPAEITVDAWLTFGGIRVQLGDAGSAEAALSRLAEFTGTEGLVDQPDAPGVAIHFGPAA